MVGREKGQDRGHDGPENSVHSRLRGRQIHYLHSISLFLLQTIAVKYFDFDLQGWLARANHTLSGRFMPSRSMTLRLFG